MMLSKLRDLYFIVILLGFAFLILNKWSEVKEIFVLVNSQNILYLFIALVLQLLTYIVTALTFFTIIKTMGVKVPFNFLFKASFITLSLNQVVPTLGFSGGAYFVSKLKSHGVSTGKSTLSLVLENIIFYIAFFILMFLGVFYLFIDHKLTYIQILLTLLFLVFMILSVVYFFYLLKSKERISHFVYRIYAFIIKLFKKKENKKGFDYLTDEFFIGKDMMLKNKKKFIEPFIFCFLKTIFDILTVYFIFLSFGYNANLGVITVGLCVATLLSYISFLPGGVGVFELIMAGIFAGFGIPFYLSFVSTLIFRGLSFWLPIPVGLYLYKTTK